MVLPKTGTETEWDNEMGAISLITHLCSFPFIVVNMLDPDDAARHLQRMPSLAEFGTL